jgi:ABC-type multidrug transport system fused ATPase/permease subunit
MMEKYVIINGQVISVKYKSIGLQILLTVCFGCFGLLYSSVVGAVILILIAMFIGWIFVSTGSIGFYFISAFFLWVISIIWGIVMVLVYNHEKECQIEELRQETKGKEQAVSENEIEKC